METLGSLCDKLTIVKLKEYHTIDKWVLTTLRLQSRRLSEEIDKYIDDAFIGFTLAENMVIPSTKIYNKEGNEFPEISGDIGFIISELALVNCKVWHQQEKVYEFEKVLPKEKDGIIKQLAILNLQRNQCIDSIDKQFQKIIISWKMIQSWSNKK